MFVLPVPFLFIIGVFVLVMWFFRIIDLVCEGSGWLASMILFLVVAAVGIGFPIYSYQTRPFVERTKDIVFVDNKAVISEGENIVQLSRITGESYKPGDVVKFKEYSDVNNHLLFCFSWKERIRDFEVVLHKAD